jgi:hypothetical protein
MENLPRNLVFASIVLILISMFGGDLLGSWFVDESEVKDSGFLLIEENSRFMLEEVEIESNCDAPRAQEACLELYGEVRETRDFEYSSEGWEAMEDIMSGQIRNLLYVCLLSACVILYFLNEKELDKAAIICFLLGGICILTVLIFVITFPMAVEEDTKLFSDIEESPSIYGSTELESPDPNDSYSYASKWRPGIAPLFVLLSGIMALISFYEIKIKNSTGDKTVPSLETNHGIDSLPQTDVDIFKPKEDIVACPGCGSEMNVPILNKLQDIKCASCGLEGEIKK